ncbi:cytochrome c [Phaeovulum sp. NW3]|uniref:c-type cytochrome n=1 Tax=Phaeovulum sp. NW3 TaxID=2934933 RepID=UPI002020D13D|nr:cytochrome c [Phaeovulum sp. NW3]MCL7464203.1 cytochrome c [Phaeovulum sp. NW3]
MVRAARFAITFTIGLSATAGLAQGPDIGAGLYAQYCASCHGAGGQGDGPMAELLTVKAPDLTGLAAANDGAFPMLKVIHIIDGRTGLRAHGGEMPVFGQSFMNQHPEADRTYGDVIETRGRVLSLAMYLETLQQ